MPNDLPPLPEPAGWLRVESEGRESLDPLFLLCKTIPNKTHYRASYAPLFTYRHLREYAAIARQQGRDEMREWNASRVRDEAWQPIETAPRDSTFFLAYRRGQIATASCLVRDDGEMWSFGNQSGHRDVYPDLVPSHWMPLPAPPVGTPKSGASRVRALSEYEIEKWWASENGLEDHDMCKLKDFREVVRAVEKKHGIGTPKSAEGEANG